MKQEASWQAVAWIVPLSASCRRVFVKARPIGAYSCDGSTRNTEKSKFILTRASVFSIVADNMELESLPKDAMMTWTRRRKEQVVVEAELNEGE